MRRFALEDADIRTLLNLDTAQNPDPALNPDPAS
jgi:hypothetical protein